MITFLLGYPAGVSEEEIIPGFNLSHLRSVIQTKSNLDRGLRIFGPPDLFRFNETVHDKWCLDKSVDQTENDLIEVSLNTG